MEKGRNGERKKRSEGGMKRYKTNNSALQHFSSPILLEL